MQKLNHKNPKTIWFNSTDQDLYIYLNEDKSIKAIEYSYIKQNLERNLKFNESSDISICEVDSGENDSFQYKQTPTLSYSEDFDEKEVLLEFVQAISDLDHEIRNDIYRFIIKSDIFSQHDIKTTSINHHEAPNQENVYEFIKQKVQEARDYLSKDSSKSSKFSEDTIDKVQRNIAKSKDIKIKFRKEE